MKFSGLAVALVLLIALTGCNGDPEPEFSDPTDTPTTSSAAATDEPLSPREEERTFVDEWLLAMEAAGQTGNLDAVRDMAASGCENCKVFFKNVREAYSDGGRVEGLKWTPRRARFEGKETNRSVWLADVRSTEETWFNGDGKVVRTVPAGINYYELELQRISGALKLADFFFREP